MATQEVSEKTPLLDEEKGLSHEEHKKKLRKEPTKLMMVMSGVGRSASKILPGSWVGEIVHKYGLKPDYGEHVELCVRASIAAMIFGVFLLHPHPQSTPWGKGVDPEMLAMMTKFALVTFYWSLGKTLGATIYNMWYLTVGQLVATFAIWVFFGVFPGGHHAPTDDVWVDKALWFGVLAGSMYVAGILWVNMDINTKILNLAFFVGFWMDYLDQRRNTNSQAWSVDFNGALWQMFLQASFGCLAGGLVSLVPYPILAKEKMRQVAKTVAHDVCLVWNDATEEYWNRPDAGVYEFDKLLHDVRSLELAVCAMDAQIGECWWECFGVGNLEETRKCLGALQDSLAKDLDHMPPVLKACAAAQHDTAETKERHQKVAKMYLPYIQNLIHTTNALMQHCTDIACNGGIEDDDEEEDLKHLRAECLKAIDALNDAVVTSRPNTGSRVKKFDLDFTDEYTFLFCASHFGRSTTKYAATLIEMRNEARPGFLAGLANLAPKGLLKVDQSPDHTKFVVRNTAAILFAFAIGYEGFPSDRIGGGEKLLARYSSGPAMVLTLMLSNFCGSALGRTLNRITGTILGIITGCAITGLCMNIWWVRVIALGIWTCATVFMFHNCSTNAGTFLLMGIYGAEMLVMQCPGGCTFEQRKAAGMAGVLGCMFALVAMVIVDIVMNAATAAAQANDEILKCWKELTKGVDIFFDKNEPNTRYNHSVLHDHLLNCQALGLEAANEPRYWKTAWKTNLYDHCVTRVLSLRFAMLCLHYSAAEGGVNGAPKTPRFLKLADVPAYAEIGRLLHERMEVMGKVLPLFGHTKVSRFPMLDDPSLIAGGFRYKIDKLINEVVEFVDKNEWVLTNQANEGDSDNSSLEKDPIAKLSVFFLCIDALLEDMQAMQHDIMKTS